MILTSIHRYNTTQLQPFLNSIEINGFSGRKVAVVYQLDESVKLHLIARGFELHEFRLERHIAEQRFADSVLAIERARAASAVDRVIMVDCRDVVFQYNPSTWLNNRIADRRIVFSSEGITHKNEPWNKQMMRDCYGSIIDELEDKMVINAGVIAGYTDDVVDLCKRQVSWIERAAGSPCDQSSLNIIVHTEGVDGAYITDDSDAWALQLHVKIHNRIPLRINQESTLLNNENKPYCIVHQYDRSPELAKIIKSIYQ